MRPARDVLPTELFARLTKNKPNEIPDLSTPEWREKFDAAPVKRPPKSDENKESPGGRSLGQIDPAS